MAAHPTDTRSTTGSPGSATGAKSGKATASMVLGIISLPALLFWPLSLVLAIVGLILGFIARGETKRGMQGSGQAMAGIVCSAIALLLIVVLFVAIGISISGDS